MIRLATNLCKVVVTLSITFIAGLAMANENVCPDAGLTGKALGLCTAYCEAMDCDSNSPNANDSACGEVQSKFLEATGLAEMPCGGGTGEPPTPSVSCPCDFSLDTWRDLLTGTDYPYRQCLRFSSAIFNNEQIALIVSDDEVFTNSFLFLADITDEPGGLFEGLFQCGAGFNEVFSPPPLGAVLFQHTYENERLPEQSGFYEACALDVENLIAEVAPALVCEERNE